MPKNDSDVSLITGFPAFTAKRLTKKVMEADPKERSYLLVRPKFRAAADEFLDEIGARKRVSLLEGDVCDMDLGLSGGEYKELAGEVTAIHHLAAIYYHGVKRDVAERVNVDGTRAVLELAGECARLRRLCHYSTAQVS